MHEPNPKIAQVSDQVVLMGLNSADVWHKEIPSFGLTSEQLGPQMVFQHPLPFACFVHSSHFSESFSVSSSPDMMPQNN